MDLRGNRSNLATAWGNWDKEDLIICLRSHINISNFGFLAISSTQTLELVPQEELKSCYNDYPYSIPPRLDAILTTGFGFRSTHIYAEVLYFGIIFGSWSMETPKSDKWGFYKLDSLQRIGCTHRHSHKSNFPLTFPGATTLCSSEYGFQT